MNHPIREELMEYLYLELAPDRQVEVAQHLETCADCRAQVEVWRRTRQELAAWQLPARRDAASTPASRAPLHFLRLAAAALVLVFAGFGLARLTAPRPADEVALREALARQLRQEIRAELTRFATAEAARQEAGQRALAETLNQLEAQRLVDFAALRRDMETMAIRAADELQDTRQNLYRLASFEGTPPNTQR